MRWLVKGLDVFGSVVPAVLLAIVLVVVTANVIARTVLAVPFYVAHDIALIAFAGVVWFGIVGTSLNGQLFGVAYFVDRLPGRVRTGVRILAHLLVILIAVAVARAAIEQIVSARFTTFLAIGWPKWIVSAGLLAAMVGIILVQVIAIIRLLRREGTQ
jgi:TRAP-type C4-dicarboxylate transport system permease small subunit